MKDSQLSRNEKQNAKEIRALTHKFVSVTYEIQILRKSLSSHTDQSTCFTASYVNMANAVLICYDYDKDCIAKAIEEDTEFRDEIKIPLVEDLFRMLPTEEGHSNWSEITSAVKYFAFISLFIPFMDYGLDWNLAFTYNQNWNDTVSLYNCPSSSESYAPGTHIGCNVVKLDPILGEWYTIGALIATHLFQCLILTIQWVAFQPMIYSILNICCLSQRLTKGKIFKLLLVTLLIAICLPFITKIYIVLIISARTYTFKQNFKRFYDLKANQYQEKEQLLSLQTRKVELSFLVFLSLGQQKESGLVWFQRIQAQKFESMIS